MSINIGSKNKIKNSTIAEQVINNDKITTSGYCQRHPIICGVIISLITGIILLFSFWTDIILWIEGIF